MPPEDKGPGDRLRARVFEAPSRIHGTGCFARVPIPTGEHIGTFEGDEASRDGPHVLWVHLGDGELPQGRCGTNVLRYLNHADDANAGFDGFELYALRDIDAGEEITVDYTGA